jgi:hypothetical protein
MISGAAQRNILSMVANLGGDDEPGDVPRIEGLESHGAGPGNNGSAWKWVQQFQFDRIDPHQACQAQ